ncbi:MAG: hypothetical protein JW956_01290 [Calditrichaceae bacterium]|nr:hypothetical protein [Calditrichaceae bacterium]
MIELQERNDVTPECPHCKQRIEKLYFQELIGFLGKRYIYFCSMCNKVLGVSHRKGFWMG